MLSFWDIIITLSSFIQISSNILGLDILNSVIYYS